jgi:hypothetical protein
MGLSKLWGTMRNPKIAQKALIFTALLYCAGIKSDSTIQAPIKPVKQIEEIAHYSTDHEVTNHGFDYNPHGMFLQDSFSELESLSYFMSPSSPSDEQFNNIALTNLINVYNQEVGNNVGGLGRGILLNPEGYFLTNHHIISTTRDSTHFYSDQRSMRVILRDGTTRPVNILASDFDNDLALGRIALGDYEVERIRLFPDTKEPELGKEVYIAAFGWYDNNELSTEPTEGNTLVNMVFPGTVTGQLDSIKIHNEADKYSLHQTKTNSFAFIGISGSPVFDASQMLYGLISSICAPDKYMILTNGEHFMIKRFLALESTNFIPTDSIRRLVMSYQSEALQAPTYPYLSLD